MKTLRIGRAAAGIIDDAKQAARHKTVGNILEVTMWG